MSQQGWKDLSTSIWICTSEREVLGPNAHNKPGKTPICLNNPGTKVWYFILIFITKWGGEVFKKIIAKVFREKITAATAEKLSELIISTQNDDIVKRHERIIGDLENRIEDLGS
ncbi:hypothetical protein RhiirA4_474614 [Rhizophagus irregularis]|uniref:Uncharacterized protein n=1 Tax=Rhizophagus irregularis TaxID=588596 RepID=A0A2I1H8T0_9GLOM|nr:hypothetical protein RhiirA4_474614 [Rhizophagus irregularis]